MEVVLCDSFTMQAWTEEQTAMEMKMTDAEGHREKEGEDTADFVD